MGNKLSIKTIVAIGIGAAVFMILGRFAILYHQEYQILILKHVMHF